MHTSSLHMMQSLEVDEESQKDSSSSFHLRDRLGAMVAQGKDGEEKGDSIRVLYQVSPFSTLPIGVCKVSIRFHVSL